MCSVLFQKEKERYLTKAFSYAWQTIRRAPESLKWCDGSCLDVQRFGCRTFLITVNYDYTNNMEWTVMELGIYIVSVSCQFAVNCHTDKAFIVTGSLALKINMTGNVRAA